MNDTDSAIRVDVRPVIEAGVGASFSREGRFAPDSMGQDTVSPVGDASWQAEFTNVGEGVHVRGSLRAELTAACVRCLEEVVLSVESSLDELFYKEPTLDEQGDALPVIDDEGYVDIALLLRDALVMAMPFKPLHDEDCKGLCAGCGANLNVEDCRCEERPDSSHPFAGLKDLL